MNNSANMRQFKSVFEIGEPARIEACFCQNLAKFIRFSDSALYFTQAPPAEPELLAEEARLLLPLGRAAAGMAVLRLDGVDIEAASGAMPYLPAIVALCLENIELSFWADLDRGTGLVSEEALLEKIAANLDAGAARPKDICFGLILIRWPEGPKICAKSDAVLFGKFRERAAELFRAVLPEGAIAARLGLLEGREEFGALVTTTGRGACNDLARLAMEKLAAGAFYDPLIHEDIYPRLCAGHALYPQDMDGRALLESPYMQAAALRNRARLAADIAWRTGKTRLPTLAYGWLPGLGARIEELLPRRFARINLGLNANIRKDQRFYVISPDAPWSPASGKAQVIVRQARETDAVVEILYVRQAGDQPAPGDGLLPVRPGDAPADMESGPLLQQAEFLSRFAVVARKERRFFFAITRFWRENNSNGAPEDNGESFKADLASLMETFLKGRFDSGLAGWYGCDGVILYRADCGREEAKSFFENLRAAGATAGFGLASGVFVYPFLDYVKDDSEINALKALEYAELLPEPHIGFLDAKALAISADKHYSQGDGLGALEEYRLALTLAPDDAMILNSFGVCLASLGRSGEAENAFASALAVGASGNLRAEISYNLANLRQKENDLAAARDYCRDCIKIRPDHIYAWARLGQIYDKAGRPKISRALYRRASRLARNQPAAFNMIQRQLARLESERNQTEKAREILHDSLLRDPGDRASLLLLARTYLADDPAMAETLARRCLRLGGDAWDTLAEALNALGRGEEAARISSGRSL